VEDEMLMLLAHVTQRKWHLISVLTQTSKEQKSYLTDLKRPCRPWHRPWFSRHLRRCGCIGSCAQCHYFLWTAAALHMGCFYILCTCVFILWWLCIM